MKLLKFLLISIMIICFWLFNANGVKYYTSFCSNLKNKYFSEITWRKIR